MRSLSKSKWMEAVQSYVLYFFFYSVLGWLYEVFLEVVVYRWGFTNRGVLLGPYCPVYGVGALLIVHLPAAVRSRPVLLFLLGTLAATGAEYAMDWLYEKALGVHFWNYSALPGNLNGRVCLAFSAAWGVLSLVVVAWVHPAVARWVSAIPPRWTLPAGLLFLLDLGFTVYLLRTTGSTDSLRWYDRFRRPARERSP